MNQELDDKKIFFVGCGKMGSAIIKNLLKQGFEYPQFTILKPSKKNLIAGIKYISSYQDLSKDFQADIVFFAFKPQVAKAILLDFSEQKIFNEKTVFISILAGKTTEFFEEILGKNAKVIRLMPNLPTLINEGIFGYYYNLNFKKSEINFLSDNAKNNSKHHYFAKFLDKIGQNILVEKEELMDVVTAISGSGPAYLFLFIKSLIEIAVKLGLDKKSAERLVEQTIYGSAKVAVNSEKDLASLIKSVASKGGTTEAALEVLKKNNQFKKTISSAVKAANKRAQQLSKISNL